MAAKKTSKKTAQPKVLVKTSAKKQAFVSQPAKYSLRRLGLRSRLLFIALFALVGGYLLFTSFADTPVTDGVLVGMQDVRPIMVTADQNGTVHRSTPGTSFKVLNTNTLVCGDNSDPDTVTTADLTADQVTDIVNRVIAAGIASQPSEIDAPAGPRLGNYTLVSVNSGGTQKQVALYGNVDSNEFGRAVRAIGKDACKQASTRLPQNQAPQPKHAVGATKAQTGSGQKLAEYVQRKLMAKAAADGYLVDDETAVYQRSEANRTVFNAAPKLSAASCLRDRARYWSTQMAAMNSMQHSPSLGSTTSSSSILNYCNVVKSWDAYGENIGWFNCDTAQCATRLIDMMMSEDAAHDDGHRQNLLSANYKYYGVGVYYDSTEHKLWLTQDFLNCANSNCGITTYTPTYANGLQWHGWTSTGFSISGAGQPSVVSPDPGEHTLFVCGMDGHVYYNAYRYYYDSMGRMQVGWTGWYNLGGSCVGNVAAASWAPGRYDVFAISPTGVIQQNSYSSGWSGWAAFSGSFAGSLAVDTRGPGKLDLYARGNDGSMHARYYSTTNGWTAWGTIAGGTVSNQGAAATYRSITASPLNLFAVGGDNALKVNHYGGYWVGWSDLGGGLSSGIAAVAPDDNHITVAARGTNNVVYINNYTLNQGFAGYGRLDSLAVSQGPTITSWDPSRLDIFVRGADGYLWQNSRY